MKKLSVGPEFQKNCNPKRYFSHSIVIYAEEIRSFCQHFFGRCSTRNDFRTLLNRLGRLFADTHQQRLNFGDRFTKQFDPLLRLLKKWLKVLDGKGVEKVV